MASPSFSVSPRAAAAAAMDWEGALLRQRKGATIAKAFVDLEGSTAPISHINENIQDAQQLLDIDFSATFDNLIVQVIGVVAFVGDHGGGGEPVDEFVRMSDIVFLSGIADQPDRIAQGVSSGMDFGTQTPSGAAQALGMWPLFSGALRRLADAPRTIVESIISQSHRLPEPAPRTRPQERPSRSSDNSVA
jgi:hypothetical protein